MRRLILSAAIFFLVPLGWAFAQPKIICGRIIDSATNLPIEDALVKFADNPVSVRSDAEGKFCIETQKDSEKLIFSHIGYQHRKLEALVEKGKPLMVLLEPELLILKEIVVSANKNVSSAREQTTLANIISKQMIEESAGQNITQALVKQPGVSLAGQTYHAAPSIRGLARKRVVVMLDGEKITSERNVGPPGTFINPFEIETIEVLKGPYSTLYGSDAIGGVVNITSKSFEEPYYLSNIGGRLDVSSESVSNAKNLNLGLNAMYGNWLVHLSAGIRDANNYDTPDTDGLMNTYHNEKHVSGKLTYLAHPNHTLTLKSYYSDGGEIGKPAFDTFTNSIHDRDDHVILGINYQWQEISPLLSKIELNLTRHYHDLGVKIIKHKVESDPTEDKLVNNQKNLDNTDYIFQGDFYFTPNPNLKLLAGVDVFFHQDLNVDERKVVRNFNSGIFIKEEAPILLSDAYQRSYGLFLQADYNPTEKLFTNAGVRWNTISTNGKPNSDASKDEQAVCANVGLSYLVTDQLNLKANIGSAFRAPDVKELYVTTNTPGGLNIGNPDLSPEKSFNIDFSAIYEYSSGLFELSLFRNQIDDMIILDWNDKTANREGTFRNIGKGLFYGVEFSLKQNLSSSFSAYLNGAWIKGKDTETDDELQDVPPFHLNAGIKYKPLQKLTLHPSVRFSAEQSEVAEDDFPNDAFTVVDLSANLQLMTNLSLSASVTNVLNESYREHFMFTWMQAPGRSFNTGLHFNF